MNGLSTSLNHGDRSKLLGSALWSGSGAKAEVTRNNASSGTPQK